MIITTLIVTWFMGIVLVTTIFGGRDTISEIENHSVKPEFKSPEYVYIEIESSEIVVSHEKILDPREFEYLGEL